MKKILSILALVWALCLGHLQAGVAYSSNTNFGAVGVGSGSSYTVLSGVAEAIKEVDLNSIMQGTDGLTTIDGSVITTALYVANPTNLTLSAKAIFYPSQVDTGIMRIKVRVPKNYRSGGILHLAVHTAVTYTANLTITASAVQYPIGSGVTNTTLVGLAGTYLGTQASSVNPPADLSFPVGLTLTPGALATYHVVKAGALILQVVDVWWTYRPFGVINGN